MEHQKNIFYFLHIFLRAFHSLSLSLSSLSLVLFILCKFWFIYKLLSYAICRVQYCMIINYQFYILLSFLQYPSKFVIFAKNFSAFPPFLWLDITFLKSNCTWIRYAVIHMCFESFYGVSLELCSLVNDTDANSWESSRTY